VALVVEVCNSSDPGGLYEEGPRTYGEKDPDRTYPPNSLAAGDRLGCWDRGCVCGRVERRGTEARAAGSPDFDGATQLRWIPHGRSTARGWFDPGRGGQLYGTTQYGALPTMAWSSR
jgi:hypothetical protein